MSVCVCVYSGLTSLSTIFQSYHVDIYEGTNLLTDLYIKFNFCCLRLSTKELQPHSLYKFSNETDLVRPVTILAASFLSLSRATESCWEQPSQTIDEYSNIGKTKENYI